jgi:hypothetical protein
MGNPKLGGGGALERSNWLAKNELLRLKYMFQGREQFLVQRAVLALEVQHWHGRWRGIRAGR